MGKNLKGKEIGKGIRQRKDGRYEARITIKGSGKPPFSIYGTNLQQVRKQRSMYLAEVLPGVQALIRVCPFQNGMRNGWNFIRFGILKQPR